MENLSYRALCSVNDIDTTLQLNLTTGDSRTDTITRLINAASHEISAFTDREFISGTKDYWDDPSDTEEREFDYAWYGLGNNVIEVGDMMVAPTSVSISNLSGSIVTLVEANEYDLLPKNRPDWQPIQFLRFLQHRLHRDYVVTIVGKWGFPVVPEDIRNACIETVRLWYDQTTLHSATIESDFSGPQVPRNLPPHVIVSISKYRHYKG